MAVRKTKRQKQAENTKKRIFKVASKLMEKRGFESVTVDEICKLAGVAKGGFYHHFPNKGELIMEVYRKIDSDFIKAVGELSADISLRERIIFSNCFIAKIANEKGPEFCKEVYKGQLDWGTNFFLSKNRPIYQDIFSSTEKYLDAVETSGLPSAQDITKMLILAARGVVYDWILERGAYDIESFMRQTIELLYDGIFKED
ncbi:MAG: TetR/AcrR family transcriptional regulator [Desulfobacterales bacterium]|nr:TetR/AcrR family transcriptional regulator [Desulfobacterales bacterium]